MNNSVLELNFIPETSVFISYRLPGEQTQHTFVQERSEVKTLSDLNGIEKESGFLFAPFPDVNHDHPIFLFSPGHHFEHLGFQKTNRPNFLRNYPTNQLKQANKQAYIKMVQKAIATLQQEKLEKVVLSRPIHIDVGGNFDALACFDRLCQMHPSAFVYLVHLPESGMWIGASPETLLRLSNNQLSIDSLAGTRALTTKSEPWPEKEREEQRLVSSYIESVLKEFDLSEVVHSSLTTKNAGNIEHLYQEFNATILSSSSFALSKFIDALQPTPAVCGTPKTAAMAYILNEEGYDRSYYSGFLGPLNIAGESHLFVNLRCMHVCRNQFTLFVGGGITADSIPEKEWEETCMKSATLLNVIKNL
jgi:isochorismate synthase